MTTEERGSLTPTDMRPHHPFKATCNALKRRQRNLDQRQLHTLDDEAVLRDAIDCLNDGETLLGTGVPASTVPYVVLSADIRKSTFLMKEAEDLTQYARVMTSFIRSARQTVGEFGGWFDKFMGDGFLAYWPCRLYGHPIDGHSLAAEHLNLAANAHMFDALDHPGATNPTTVEHFLSTGLLSAMSAATLLIKTFERTHKPEFRRGSRNFRADTGLTVGIDMGLIQVVPIGEEITVVGHPVVGAVRMTSAGEAGQIIANARVGDFVHETKNGGSAQATLTRRFTFTPTVVTTKEYEQEGYAVQQRR